MCRRLTGSLLLLLLLALAPGTAAAEPPDERANARALADIALRAATQMSHVSEAIGPLDSPPSCKTTRRLHQRGTPQDVEAVAVLYRAHWIARFSRATQPALASAVVGLQAVPTADPALRSGRTAWRRVLSAYTRFGALTPVRFCSVQRDYVRSDFHPTPAMRIADRMYRRANNWDTTDVDRRQARAIARLIELGVSPADADAFNGEVGEQ